MRFYLTTRETEYWLRVFKDILYLHKKKIDKLNFLIVDKETHKRITRFMSFLDNLLDQKEIVWSDKLELTEDELFDL